MFNVVPRMNCLAYWLVTYTRTKRKDRPFIFMLKFLRKKNYDCSQLTIENQQKGHYFKSWSAQGTLYLRTWRAPGILYLSARSTQGTQIKFYEFLWHSNKEYPECSGSSNKEYPVCSRTSNKDLFAYFQLSIVKKCNFSLGNSSIKIKGLSFLFNLV